MAAGAAASMGTALIGAAGVAAIPLGIRYLDRKMDKKYSRALETKVNDPMKETIPERILRTIDQHVLDPTAVAIDKGIGAGFDHILIPSINGLWRGTVWSYHTTVAGCKYAGKKTAIAVKTTAGVVRNVAALTYDHALTPIGHGISTVTKGVVYGTGAIVGGILFGVGAAGNYCIARPAKWTFRAGTRAAKTGLEGILGFINPEKETKLGALLNNISHGRYNTWREQRINDRNEKQNGVARERQAAIEEAKESMRSYAADVAKVRDLVTTVFDDNTTFFNELIYGHPTVAVKTSDSFPMTVQYSDYRSPIEVVHSSSNSLQNPRSPNRIITTQFDRNIGARKKQTAPTTQLLITLRAAAGDTPSPGYWDDLRAITSERRNYVAINVENPTVRSWMAAETTPALQQEIFLTLANAFSDLRYIKWGITEPHRYTTDVSSAGDQQSIVHSTIKDPATRETVAERVMAYASELRTRETTRKIQSLSTMYRTEGTPGDFEKTYLELQPDDRKALLGSLFAQSSNVIFDDIIERHDMPLVQEIGRKNL